jgi:uncharacterized LabA/DUF88 family protein
MGRIAIFVDAGYFWVQACQSVLGRKGSRNEIVIDYSILRSKLLDVFKTFCTELLRIYWYDGPSQTGKGSDHSSIEELDDFKLRLGTRNFKGEQKAVDGLIIADMLSLTQSKAIDQAVLLSGDADLTPGVTAAQAMGLRVHLCILDPKSSTSPYLAAEADRKLYLNTAWIKSFAKAADRPNTPTTQATTAVASDVPPVVDSETHRELSFRDIAQRAHTKMMATSLATTLSDLGKKDRLLPQDIDKHLLYEGKAEMGRPLSEQEKRSLRAAFKALL